jgi:hydrogenase-4 component B
MLVAVMALLVCCALLTALSGIPGLYLRAGGGRAAAWLMGAGALAGLAAAALVLAGAGPAAQVLSHTPLGSPGYLRLDPIGAFFLVPVAVLPACGAVFGVGYWGEGHEGARTLRLLYGLTTGFLVVLVAAAHALTFLLAWEGMAVAGFVLVMAEDRDPATRRAGWVYLAATHTGTLCLFAAFGLAAGPGGLFGAGAGGFLFTPAAPGLAATSRGALTFLLFLVGFGFKAGIFPLHFWLPPAHGAAPSHVSSIMSGVVIKMGILGLVRLVALVPDPPLWWGALLVVLGALSGLLGVAFALAQHDLKRLLAYHSIENIGIILLGLGLGTLGKASGHPVLALLGFAGALLHVLNHSLFKGLLFLGAGSVVHATGSRDLERLGGLGHTMPFTAAAFLAGSWAICGLPPLNGFVSEWLIYLAAFQGLAFLHPGWSVLALAALAMIGALAAACFAKVYGVVFQGRARSPEAARAAEVSLAMRAPMGVLACACIGLGAAPLLVAPALARAAAALAGTSEPLALGGIAHLWVLSALALPLAALAVLLWAWSRRRGAHTTGQPTWDCGYAADCPRAQYTASSFADSLVGSLRYVLWPRERRPKLRALFPGPRGYRSHVPDPVLERAAEPGFDLAARGLGVLRFLQGGHLALYLLYILVTLVVLFLWMVA